MIPQRLMLFPIKGDFMIKKISYLGIFTSLALICSYVESLIPFSIGIPGVKLGLTNIVVVLTLFCIGEKEALIISVIRILLAGFLFGNMFAIIYSLAGGILSFLIMVLLKKIRLKIISVSVSGGIFHNIGQVIVAALVVENGKILFYIPVLIVSGLITGLIIGIVSQEIVIRIGDHIKY